MAFLIPAMALSYSIQAPMRLSQTRATVRMDMEYAAAALDPEPSRG